MPNLASRLPRFVGSVMLAAAFSGCVASAAEKSMMATSAAEATRKVPLTPEMRQGIAEAVYRASPDIRLASNSTLLAAQISAVKNEPSEYDGQAYRAYYCVRVIVERPLINAHTLYAVYPVDRGDGHFDYRLQWKRYKPIAACLPEVELNPYPELAKIYEDHRTSTPGI